MLPPTKLASSNRLALGSPRRRPRLVRPSMREHAAPASSSTISGTTSRRRPAIDRLDRRRAPAPVVVRVFRAEGQLRLHLLVDISRSMGIGTPDKLAGARRAAAALCYRRPRAPRCRRRADFRRIRRRHVGRPAGRAPDFRGVRRCGASSRRALGDRSALIDYGGAVRGPGLVVVISDFFHPDGALDGLRYLLYRGLTPAIVQVVSDDELQPGDRRRRGAGGYRGRERRVSRRRRGVGRRLSDRLARMSAELEGFCFSRSLPWLRVASSASFQSLVKACQQAGLLAARA